MFKINFIYIFRSFYVLILKIIFLKKLHYFNVFLNKKYFKKQSLPNFQTPSKQAMFYNYIKKKSKQNTQDN